MSGSSNRMSGRDRGGPIVKTAQRRRWPAAAAATSGGVAMRTRRHLVSGMHRAMHRGAAGMSRLPTAAAAGGTGTLQSLPAEAMAAHRRPLAAPMRLGAGGRRRRRQPRRAGSCRAWQLCLAERQPGPHQSSRQCGSTLIPGQAEGWLGQCDAGCSAACLYSFWITMQMGEAARLAAQRLPGSTSVTSLPSADTLLSIPKPAVSCLQCRARCRAHTPLPSSESGWTAWHSAPTCESEFWLAAPMCHALPRNELA